MKLSDLLLTDAKERGLDHFFGIPGSGFPMDAMESGKRISVDFVHVAHESTAGIAAAYYGHEKNTAGLALAVKGVGAANLVGGAANSHFERKPLICVCESGPNEQDIDLVQVCDQLKLFGSVSSYQADITLSNAREQLRTAIEMATNGRPNVSVLNIPSDYVDGNCGDLPDHTNLNSSKECNEKDIQLVANRISNCRKPLFIVGADVERDHAIKELQALTEKLGAAVLVNMDARGIYPEQLPRWAGVFTGNYNKNTIEGDIAKDCDLIILIGTDSMMTHIPWQYNKPSIEITANPDYKTTSTNPELRADGNLKNTIKTLTQLVVSSDGFHIDEINAIKHSVLRHFNRDPDAKFTVQDIVESLRAEMPSDGTLITETGAFIRMFEYLWPVNTFGSYLGTSGGRTMGLTIPASIGYALAHPSKTKIGVGADGSTLMRLGELEVFSRMGIKMPLVIINDMALGTMKSRQKSRGFNPHGLNFQGVDFAKIAQSCGLYGVTVEDPESFQLALRNSLVANKTTLIDARIDQQPYWDGFALSIGAI